MSNILTPTLSSTMQLYGIIEFHSRLKTSIHQHLSDRQLDLLVIYLISTRSDLPVATTVTMVQV